MVLFANYRNQIYAQSVEMDNFMCLLMKERNRRGKWTKEEIDKLVIQIKHLSTSAPFLILLVLPFGFLMLPLLANWLDRRKQPRPLTGG